MTLDLRQAYLQLEVHEQSQKFLGINTQWGLFIQTRLPFGLHSSAQVFQWFMDQLLTGIEQVTCYLDDVLIYGGDRKECYSILIKILERFPQHNVEVRWEKSQWFQNKLTYLGHDISDKGIMVSAAKINPIMNYPTPKNTTELKSFLGMIQFYHRHLPNFSAKIPALFQLLKKIVTGIGPLFQ